MNGKREAKEKSTFKRPCLATTSAGEKDQSETAQVVVRPTRQKGPEHRSTSPSPPPSPHPFPHPVPSHLTPPHPHPPLPLARLPHWLLVTLRDPRDSILIEDRPVTLTPYSTPTHLSSCVGFLLSSYTAGTACIGRCLLSPSSWKRPQSSPKIYLLMLFPRQRLVGVFQWWTRGVIHIYQCHTPHTTHTHTHARARAHTHARTPHARTHARTHTHAHTHARAHTHTRTHTLHTLTGYMHAH